MKIYISIEDLASLECFIEEAQKVGLLKGVNANELTFNESDFPMRLPVDIDAFLKLTGNPIVKKVFGKKIESTLQYYLMEAK